MFRAYSSAVEPPAHNRSVPGSIPGGPTKKSPATNCGWAFFNGPEKATAKARHLVVESYQLSAAIWLI